MLRAHDYLAPYNDAPGSTEEYRGTDHTVATMIRLAKGAVDPRTLVQKSLAAERSIPVRRHTEQIVSNVRPKDYSSEVIAIGRWWGNAGRYTRDPLHVEMLRDVPRLINDALAARLACDCDEFALAIGACCLAIGARVQFVTVGFSPRYPGQPKAHTHVFCRAQDPRTKVWWVLDPVAGRRVGQMLKRVKQYTIFEVD
jgi:hypothetical protein